MKSRRLKGCEWNEMLASESVCTHTCGQCDDVVVCEERTLLNVYWVVIVDECKKMKFINNLII